MRFWWVNQNQTFEQEIAGGYLIDSFSSFIGTDSPSEPEDAPNRVASA
jgi:hypothetical protein